MKPGYLRLDNEFHGENNGSYFQSWVSRPLRTGQAPPKQIEILGQQIVESELDNILGQGSDGVLG